MIKSLGVGKFGRCLGVLFRADDEDESKWVNLNEELVTQGFAVEYWGGDRSRKKTK
jgi:endonuclease YncB( thermonuclease family)